MSVPLRIGIVGTGGMAQVRAATLAKNPRTKLVGVASRSLERARAMTQTYGGEPYSDWKTLATSPSIDALIICTPNDLHKTMILKALTAGKHILCEYVLTPTVQEGRDVFNAWRKTDRILHVGHTMRFSGKQQTLKTVIRDLGPLRLAQFDVVFGRKPRKWYPDPIRLGSVFVGAMVHFHDEQRQLFGDVAWVDGHLQQSLTKDGLVDWDVASMWIGFAQGGLGQINYGRGLEAPGWVPRERYVFARGYVETTDEYVLVQTGENTARHPIPAIDPIQADTDAFISEVLDDTPQSFSPVEALKAVEIGEAAARSAELGQRMMLAPK